MAILIQKIQEILTSKKLVRALFMNFKGSFNYLSMTQLLKLMIELGINEDLVAWTSLFFTNRKIQLVIDKHENIGKEIEMEIL